MPVPAGAQLEVLLRGIEPTKPIQGVCARYRFEAREPDGDRIVEFVACVERVPRDGKGVVVLHLTSGDSLEARIEVDPALFDGGNRRLVDHIRSVTQVDRGTTRRLGPDEWQDLPALAPAPELPVVADSSLGASPMQVGTRTVQGRGRRLREARQVESTFADVQMTQTETRDLEVWTAAEAPILGVVQARATVRSERTFARPIPGVPPRGPRVSYYALDLVEWFAPR